MPNHFARVAVPCIALTCISFASVDAVPPVGAIAEGNETVTLRINVFDTSKTLLTGVDLSVSNAAGGTYAGVPTPSGHYNVFGVPLRLREGIPLWRQRPQELPPRDQESTQTRSP